MSRELLRTAAAKAGITEEQAEVFVTELIHPTTQQCNQADQCGADSIPPFSWPKDIDPETEAAWQEWSGLSSGEYRFTEYARTWRLMCAALLLDEPRWSWASEKWPHPKSDFNGERIKDAMTSPFEDAA